MNVTADSYTLTDNGARVAVAGFLTVGVRSVLTVDADVSVIVGDEDSIDNDGVRLGNGRLAANGVSVTVFVANSVAIAGLAGVMMVLGLFSQLVKNTPENMQNIIQ